MTIKLARQSAGLTQKQLADKTGINIRQIQKVEAGEIKVSNLTAANYIHLCRVLRLDPKTQIMEGYKMTRDTAKELQRKYNMEITRHPVTSEACALTVDSEDLIPELDDLADGAPDIALPFPDIALPLCHDAGPVRRHLPLSALLPNVMV